MSNEYVIASAQFLKESWYRENAGTPEIQKSKLLDEVFDDIIDYCLEIGFNIEESIDFANEVIEEDLIEEFYDEILNEAGISTPSLVSTPTQPSSLNFAIPRRLQQNTSSPLWNSPTPIQSTSPTPTTSPTSRSIDAFSAGGGAAKMRQGLTRSQVEAQGKKNLTRQTQISPTAPKIEPTAPPIPRPTLPKLGQGSQDSIFSRGTSVSPQQARSDYEDRMRQAIRSGTKFNQPQYPNPST